nr:unnamed protein product [Spirometra erinaceieuropaei]
MVIFYRRPLPNCSDLMLPLTNMLSNIKALLELTGDPLTAFERIKASLADATPLTHPALEAQLSLAADALTVASRSPSPPSISPPRVLPVLPRPQSPTSTSSSSSSSSSSNPSTSARTQLPLPPKFTSLIV